MDDVLKLWLKFLNFYCHLCSVTHAESHEQIIVNVFTSGRG